MSVWWDIEKICTAGIKHDKNYGKSAAYIEPFSENGLMKILNGKRQTAKSRSSLGVPVILTSTVSVDDYIIFTRSGEFTKNEPTLHGWIAKVTEVDATKLSIIPAVGQLDGKDIVYNPSDLVMKDFFVVSHNFPTLAGWEMNDEPKGVEASTCPKCGAPTRLFRLAPYCPACNIIQTTDTWGRSGDWVPVL